MKNILLLAMLIFLCFSCEKKKKNTAIVPVFSQDLQLQRFDVDFYKNQTKSLMDLKKQYPYLFPKQIEDSVWVNKRVNPEELELFAETQNLYANDVFLQKELVSLFAHIQYYFPKFLPPKIVTLLTDIDYDSRIIYNQELLLISLDCYLGASHDYYFDYPDYIKQNATKEHLIVDIASTIITNQYPDSRARTFVDKMIDKGKKMYLLEKYLPNVSTRELFGCSEEKYQWAVANEEQIWKYFIEKELLFDTDKNLDRRFLDVAPFSKFYLEEDRFSPGRIGVWVGWQIVTSFMKNNDVSLQKLLTTSNDVVFKKSLYKPKR
ncbi:gliding motility lipoprotein GldB [Tenacibaculum sp. SG-28]|uniref:gliding motility lipoprotein GldB n=1 Tax=Tenacibaculum sp. SG-28 TaxID=754426 RepID=UPI000CF54060|nr:gliding motility lipoprotein GldB [Tenacibaculum sp. SG-28]PQJ22806.1 gliding motility lipoprotein GldB [Tenacibaculum sp. SG-28]